MNQETVMNIKTRCDPITSRL